MRPIIISCVLMLLPWGGIAQDIEPMPAEKMPLAAERLLLDIHTTGSRMIAVGTRGHVLYSDDGDQWSQAEVPIRAALTAVHGVGDLLWAVGHDAAIIHSTDAGETWQLQFFEPDLQQPLLDVYFMDADNGIAVGAYGMIVRTDDGGATWYDDLIHEEYDYHLNAIAPVEGEALVIAAEAGNGFRSMDAGATWEWFEYPYLGSMFGLLVLDNNRLLSFGLRGHIQLSNDLGDSWREPNSGIEDSLFGGMVGDDGSVILVGANGAILTRSGQQWQQHRHQDDADLSAIVEFGGKYFVVGERGIATWSQHGEGAE